MAANTGVNVLRYSALFAGVAYGLYHQAAINTNTRKSHVQAHYDQQNSVIQKAKAEWTKRTLPQEKKTADGGVITNPDDPKFDLEAYLTMKTADEQ